MQRTEAITETHGIRVVELSPHHVILIGGAWCEIDGIDVRGGNFEPEVSE